MTTPWLISYVLLWGIVLGTGFLLLGTLRSLGRLQWRFDEMKATRPVRKGREGLPVGRPAPDFNLAGIDGRNLTLSDSAGRKVLLVFTQAGCGPCHAIAPELNRLHESDNYQVIVVHHSEPNETRAWAEEVQARFPIVTQHDWETSKMYQVFATPYGFVIDEQGVIAAKGIVSTPQYIGYLFDAACKRGTENVETTDSDSSDERELHPVPTSKEVIHA